MSELHCFASSSRSLKNSAEDQKGVEQKGSVNRIRAVKVYTQEQRHAALRQTRELDKLCFSSRIMEYLWHWIRLRIVRIMIVFIS